MIYIMPKIPLLFRPIKHILKNLKEMLIVSWQADSGLLIMTFLLSGIGAFFPILSSYLYKLLIDDIVNYSGLVVTLPFVIVAVLASRFVLNVIANFTTNNWKSTFVDILFRNRMQNELNYRFYEKVSKLNLQHLEDDKTQDLITKAIDTFTWRPPDYVRRATFVFADIVEYISAFILLIPYGLIIVFLSTLVAIPEFFLRTKYGKLQWSIYGSGAPEVRKLWYYRSLLSDVTSIIESRIFQSQKLLLGKFKKIQEYLYQLNKKPLVDYLILSPAPQIVVAVFFFVVAVWKLPDVLKGTMSIGDYTFFISLLDRLVSGASGVIVDFGLMYENNLYVDYYLDVMKLSDVIKVSENPKKINLTNFPPVIEFKNVTFSYPKSKKKALNNVSFTINSGENIAIVGPNGAGKTTIVKLICRFYDVTGGEILVNGVNLKEVDLDDWYKYLGTLFQNFIHYNLTVRENITLGDTGGKNYNEARMIDAAKRSGSYEFIKEMPEGFNQMLGKRFERGKELSQGQWQKLAIARAFYEDAPILILDEPTSAIDAESEYKIFKNLHKYYKDKTLFLISHRFSTVRNADKIIVIDKGRIIEEGSHSELLLKKKVYAGMFEKQAIGYR